MAQRRASNSAPLRELEKQLERYRSMRDFQVTSEPRGHKIQNQRADPGGAFPFVIQKHDATRLHYDFRLAWNGVLKSWAVTKGPSLFPGDKRLAVEVEDHPIEYGSFEGTIPKGQYGGGSVMVWDYGTWKPLVNVDTGLAKGDLKFELNGSKLKGSWVLARMHGRNERPDKPNWLLIKHRDEFARPEDALPITDEAPDSALTGRTIDQIARDNDRTWQSRQTQRQANQAQPTPAPLQPRRKHRATPVPILSLKSFPTEALPGFIEPQLARQSSSPPTGADWVHELKLDGYRIQIHVRSEGKGKSSQKHVKLLTRKGLDWTRRLPEIARAAEELPIESGILDGEAVVLDESGTSSFAQLQASFQGGANVRQTYFAFDLLHLNGHNLRGLELLQRKALLSQILAHSDKNSTIHFCEHVTANGAHVFAQACRLGAEGIVSKLASAPYTSGRSTVWVKSKCVNEQEFVIGGFTHPSNGGPGIGAILVGYYEGGKLRYAGRSGTGFTQESQRDLRKRLDKLDQSKSPFDSVPKEAQKGVQWVQPKLVAQLAFASWTSDNLLRQASFRGLREDKPANEVEREAAIAEDRLSEASSLPARARPRLGSGPRNSFENNLPVSNPNKVLDEASGMTKKMLAEYYMSIADHILPHIAGRPLSIVRCPDGNGKPCFFQKHISIGLPEGVRSVPVPDLKSGGTEDYLTLDSSKGLVGLAQIGVFEIHPWGSRNESLEKPDRIVFDLDPDTSIDWKTLAIAAKSVRERLSALGLESFVKTTGGKGLHVVFPIRAEHSWTAVKSFAHAFVLQMEKESPGLYITNMRKALRAGRIFLDYLRNDRGSTAVAPFSPRARSGVPVALPLHWNELNGKDRPAATVATFASWKRRLKNDPWSGMSGTKQRLSAEALRQYGVRES